MNSGPYAEPKFPPNEEYSHNNYINSQHQDYYRGAVQNYGYQADDRRYGTESYTPSQNYGCATSQTVSPLQSSHSPIFSNGLHTTILPQSQQNLPTAPSPPHHGATPTNQQPCTQANGSPVIYPWMKKAHLGSGTLLIFTWPLGPPTNPYCT